MTYVSTTSQDVCPLGMGVVQIPKTVQFVDLCAPVSCVGNDDDSPGAQTVWELAMVSLVYTTLGPSASD